MNLMRVAAASLLLTGCQHYADGRDPPQCGLAAGPPAAEPAPRVVPETPPTTAHTSTSTTTEAPGRTQSHTPVASTPAPAPTAPTAPTAVPTPSPPATPAVRADQQRLLVLSPRSTVVDAPTLSTLNAMIAAEVTQQQRFNVVGTEVIPGYRANNAACDLSCLGTMAAASNARFVISGEVGRIGDVYVLTLALFDIDTGTFINRVNVQGMGIAALTPVLPAQLQRLTAVTSAVVAPSVAAAPAAPAPAPAARTPASSTSSAVRSDLVYVDDAGAFGSGHARCEVMTDRIECDVEAGLFNGARHGTWLFSQLRSIAKSSTGKVTITRSNGEVTTMVLADLKHAVRDNTPSFAQVRQAETQLALAREWQDDLLTAWNAR